VGEVGGLRKRGGDIVLSGMSPEVFDVYELLGFADVLRSFNTIGEARTWLALPPEQRGAMIPPRVGSDAGRARLGSLADEASESLDAGAEAGAARDWQSLRIEATTVGERGDIAVLSLSGIIDTVSAERLREALDQVIAGGRVKIVTDMSNVEYVSSGGWGVFTERLRELRRAGGDVKLFGMDPDVYYVFTMLGFNIVLSSFDIFADAVDDFRRSAPGTDVPVPAEASPKSARPDEPSVVRSAWSMMASTGLELSWEDGPAGIRIARLSGVIETTAVSLISDALTGEIERRPRSFLFDLTKVEYVSSSGWGQFARAFEATRSVALVGMSPDLLDVYDCLEFRNFIPAYTSEAEALRTLTGGEVPPAERSSSDVPTAAPPPSRASGPERALAPEDANGDDGLDDVLSTPSKAPSVDPPKVRDTDVSDPPPVWGRRELKDAAPPSDVDIDAAVSDRNKDRDHKIRSLGWRRYGERLRGRGDQKAGGGTDAPESDPSDET